MGHAQSESSDIQAAESYISKFAQMIEELGCSPRQIITIKSSTSWIGCQTRKLGLTGLYSKSGSGINSALW
jgi:hypothetical protein